MERVRHDQTSKAVKYIPKDHYYKQTPTGVLTKPVFWLSIMQ